MVTQDAGDGDPVIEGGEEVTGSSSCPLHPSMMRGAATVMREAMLGERNGDGDGDKVLSSSDGVLSCP